MPFPAAAHAVWAGQARASDVEVTGHRTDLSAKPYLTRPGAERTGGVPNEPHGLRKGESLVAVLEAQWSRYLHVLGLPHPAVAGRGPPRPRLSAGVVSQWRPRRQRPAQRGDEPSDHSRVDLVRSAEVVQHPAHRPAPVGVPR